MLNAFLNAHFIRFKIEHKTTNCSSFYEKLNILFAD